MCAAHMKWPRYNLVAFSIGDSPILLSFILIFTEFQKYEYLVIRYHLIS